METGFSTPLLDSFRRDEAPRDIRLLAARGELAPRAQEQLALLMMLTGDADTEVASVADATLRAIPADALAGLLARSDATEAMRAFFAARGIEPAGATPEAAGDPLADAGDGPLVVDAAGDAGKKDEETLPLLQRLAAMTVAQRLVRAMKGSREERAILIRDPSKLVSVAVLSSPRITDTEVEGIARMTNVSEEVLRIIARTRAWMKSYAVTAALAKNPKTPVALSLNLLSRLNDRELKAISTDRNVADVVRTTARRKLIGK